MPHTRHPPLPSLLAVLGALLCAPVRAQTAADPPQTIVITATRHAMALVDAPATMTVVTSEQIEQRGADNVFDALRGETGLTLVGRTISGRRVLSLRGMDGRHTLFLVDGKRVAASDGVIGHSDFQYDWVPIQDIKRIEVVRGPMSVLYGAEALGGVVNVVTRRPGETWRFGALAEGSFTEGDTGADGHRAALSLSGPVAEGVKLALSAADTRRAALPSSADPAISDLEGRHRQSASARVLWQMLRGHELQVDLTGANEERWAGARERGGPRRYYQSVTPLDREHASVGWAAEWGGAWDGRSLLRAYRSRLEARNERSGGVTPLRPNTLTEQVVEAQGSAQPQPGRLFSGGFEWRDERLDNAGLPDGRASATHRALFAQAELGLTPALDLNLGLRHDRHERYGEEWSPRAYAVWRFAPGWLLKGGYGHGFKAPTLKQVTPGYQEDEGPNTFFSNPALRPESNDGVELALGHDTAQWGAQVLLFANRVDDLVVSRLTGTVNGRPQYTFENVDSARLDGLEAEAQARVGGGFTVGGSYTYLDARDGAGQRLEKRPRHALTLRAQWAGGPWKAGLTVSHEAGQLIAGTTPGQPPQPLPALTRANAWMERALGAGLTLAVGLDNLTDLNLQEKSPLFTWPDTPRTLRVALRGTW